MRRELFQIKKIMCKKSILFIIGILNIIIVSSQTDTINYAECEIDTLPTEYDKLLKYFLADKEDVHHLWKFNIVDWGMVNPSIAFEQRLSKRSSMELESRITFTNLKLHDQYEKIFGRTNIKGELNADYRFYYNKKRREKKGKNTNGFSANYFFLGGGIMIHNKQWDINYNLKTGIGIQRRIGSVGYADIKFGAYSMNYFEDYNGISYRMHEMEFHDFFIDINLGVALKSLKRPLFK